MPKSVQGQYIGEVSVYQLYHEGGNAVLLLWEQQCTANQSCLKHGQKKQLMMFCNIGMICI